MNTYPLLKKIKFQGYVFLVAILCIITHSCRKDFKDEVNISKPQKLSIDEARNWFNSNFIQSKRNYTTDSITQMYSSFTAFWEYASVTEDSSYYVVETPITYTQPIALHIGDTTYQTIDTSALHSITRLLVLKNKSNQTLLTALMHVSGSSNADINAVHYNNIPLNFTGEISYTDYNGNYVNGSILINGVVTDIITPAENMGVSVRKKTNDLTTHLNAGCTIIAVDMYSRTCTDIVYPDGVVYYGGCTAWQYENTLLVEKCTDSGSGGSSPGSNYHGGSGGSAPPSDPPPPDPCAKKNKLNSVASNAALVQQNSEILQWSSVFEYGAEQKLTNLTSANFMYTEPRTNSNSSHIRPNFTWNSTDGYTIGFSHGHPGGTAESPRDIFWVAQNLTNPELVNAGEGAIEFYKNNASITVVTQAGNYTVAINDYTEVGLKNREYIQNPNSFNLNYDNLKDDYKDDNPFASDAEASAYALLLIFGDSITIMFTGDDNRTAYSIATLSSDGKKVVVKACQ